MKKFFLLVSLISGLSTFSFAQDDNDDTHVMTIKIAEHSLLDIEATGMKTITQEFDKPTEAGFGLKDPAANSTIWLNNSSVVSTGETRTIKVKASAVVPGVNIEVTAANASITGNNSAGTPGVGSKVATLSTADQDLITGIGSVYTGNGPNSGSNITYKLSTPNANYGNIVAATTNITITYTITNN